jgi:hypothetical protein
MIYIWSWQRVDEGQDVTNWWSIYFNHIWNFSVWFDYVTQKHHFFLNVFFSMEMSQMFIVFIVLCQIGYYLWGIV